MGLMEFLIVVLIGAIFGWGLYEILKGLDDQ